MLRSAAMLAMRLENSAVLVFTRSGDLAAKLGAGPNGAPLFAFTDVEGLPKTKTNLGNRTFFDGILKRS